MEVFDRFHEFLRHVLEFNSILTLAVLPEIFCPKAPIFVSFRAKSAKFFFNLRQVCAKAIFSLFIAFLSDNFLGDLIFQKKIVISFLLLCLSQGLSGNGGNEKYE